MKKKKISNNPKANIYEEFMNREYGNKKNQNKVVELPKDSPEYKTVYLPTTGVNPFANRKGPSCK
jgi:hypothetical protein